MWILLANLVDTEALSGTRHVWVVYHSDILFIQIFSFGCQCWKDPYNKDQNACKVAEKLNAKNGRHKRTSNSSTQRIVGKMHLQTFFKKIKAAFSDGEKVIHPNPWFVFIYIKPKNILKKDHSLFWRKNQTITVGVTYECSIMTNILSLPNLPNPPCLTTRLKI